MPIGPIGPPMGPPIGPIGPPIWGGIPMGNKGGRVIAGGDAIVGPAPETPVVGPGHGLCPPNKGGGPEYPGVGSSGADAPSNLGLLFGPSSSSSPSGIPSIP